MNSGPDCQKESYIVTLFVIVASDHANRIIYSYFRGNRHGTGQQNVELHRRLTQARVVQVLETSVGVTCNSVVECPLMAESSRWLTDNMQAVACLG